MVCVYYICTFNLQMVQNVKRNHCNCVDSRRKDATFSFLLRSDGCVKTMEVISIITGGLFPSLRGGSPSAAVNICPNMAARVNTGGQAGSFDQRHMSPCVFHTMTAFNERFIISTCGQKNSREGARNDLRGKELRDNSLAIRGKQKSLVRKAKSLL